MKNITVVESFINKGLKCKSKNLLYEEGMIYSYYTCVAKWVKNKVFINSTQYSMTTTHHVNLIKRKLEENQIKYLELKEEEFHKIEHLWR